MGERIKLTDTRIDVAIKMGEGNPGALTFIVEILQTDIDKLKYIFILDELGLYGSRLYQLWSDCCQRNTEKVFKVLDKYSKNELTREFILDCVNQPWGKNIEVENSDSNKIAKGGI